MRIINLSLARGVASEFRWNFAVPAVDNGKVQPAVLQHPVSVGGFYTEGVDSDIIF